VRLFGSPCARPGRRLVNTADMRATPQGGTALVTGSTQGIGLAIVSALAEAGAWGIVNGRSEGSVERAIAELRV
jgi:short-subunit dehydrogenase